FISRIDVYSEPPLHIASQVVQYEALAPPGVATMPTIDAQFELQPMFGLLPACGSNVRGWRTAPTLAVTLTSKTPDKPGVCSVGLASLDVICPDQSPCLNS